MLKLAKEKNIPVSFDPNIRLKLWTIEEAITAYMEIFPYVDILLTGLDEIDMIMGDSSVNSLEACAEHFEISPTSY